MANQLLVTLLDHLSKSDFASKIRPPPNCPRYRLSEIFTAKKGKVPKLLSGSFNEQARPYINIKAFERGVIDRYVLSNDGVPVSGQDIMIVWDGARSGLVGNGKNGILGSTLKKLSLQPAFDSTLLPYLFYFLQQQYKYLNYMSRGSVIKHVDSKAFWDMKVQIPDGGMEQFDYVCKLLDVLEQVEGQMAKELELVKEIKEVMLNNSFLIGYNLVS